MTEWRDEVPWMENPDPSIFDEEWAQYIGGPYDGTTEQRWVPRGSQPQVVGVQFARPEDYDERGVLRTDAVRMTGYYVPDDQRGPLGTVIRRWREGGDFPRGPSGNPTVRPVMQPTPPDESGG